MGASSRCHAEDMSVAVISLHIFDPRRDRRSFVTKHLVGYASESANGMNAVAASSATFERFVLNASDSTCTVPVRLASDPMRLASDPIWRRW